MEKRAQLWHSLKELVRNEKRSEEKANKENYITEKAFDMTPVFASPSSLFTEVIHHIKGTLSSRQQ